MSIGNPTVTVGIPVYNSEKFLGDTLRSVLSQSLADIEVVISDNASSDASAQICQEFAALDRRIRYFQQSDNIGVPRNYNFVLSLARGRFFKWCSSNDICQPRFLEACVQVLEQRDDAVLAYPRTRLFDSQTNTCEDYDDNLDLQMEDVVERYVICSERLRLNNVMNGVIRTDLLRRTTLHWDYPSSDLEMSKELTLYGKFVEVPETLFYRRSEAAAMFGIGTKARFGQYYPDARFGSRSSNWRRLHQQGVGMLRAPLRLFDRLRLCRMLLRQIWWKRADLIR